MRLIVKLRITAIMSNFAPRIFFMRIKAYHDKKQQSEQSG